MNARIHTSEAAFWPAGDGAAAVTLDDDLACDVAIVGGGYSGLSAAYHLQRRSPGLRIALFEQGRIGQGASGVNSGQCSPRIGPAIGKQVAALGADTARACYQYSLDAIAATVGLIEREGIACALQPGQQLQLALTSGQAEELRRTQALYRQLGFSLDYLQGPALARLLPASPSVRAALAYPAYTLNPRQLCLGLKRAVLAAGVRVFEHSPVRTSGDGQVRLACNGHTVEADKLVIATDGWTARTGLFAETIFPIRGYCAVTPPLAPELLDGLWGAGLGGIYDSRRIFNFFRVTPDRRLLIGGEYHFAAPGTGDDPDRARQAGRQLQQALAGFFPALAGVPLDMLWSGLMGCTLDGWPVIAPVGRHGNAWYVGAWNGHGVALATASGAVLADLVQGGAAPPAYPWFRTASIPGVPARGLARPAINAYLAYQRLRDRLAACRT